MELNDSILQKLLDIQSKLKVEKGTYNKFGEFYYRSKEDILEAAKPMCHERGLTLLCDDEVRCLDNGWVYVTTTVTLTDVLTGECVTAKASAREPESKPKMDSSQVSGSAASYAGKRALGNLFALDDTKDADGYEGNPNTKKSGQQSQKPTAGQPFIGACTACGTQYQFQSPEQAANCVCQCGNRVFEAA